MERYSRWAEEGLQLAPAGSGAGASFNTLASPRDGMPLRSPAVYLKCARPAGPAGWSPRSWPRGPRKAQLPAPWRSHYNVSHAITVSSQRCQCQSRRS